MVYLSFEGYHRDWNPLPGHTPPDEPLFEMRCRDTDLVVCGKTIQEAYDRLMEAKKAKEEHERKNG